MKQKNLVKKEKETILELAKNYGSREQSLVNQLAINSPNHPSTTGSYRERVWKELFEGIIPKKYCIAQSVFIIDSYGSLSKEVDLAVYDEMYTPYIFNYGEIKFIPIEAVAIVIQCKSEISGSEMKKSLENWVKSIDQLHTSLNSVTRVIGWVQDNLNPSPSVKGLTQTETRPIKILCATKLAELKETESKFDIVLWVENNHFAKKIYGEQKEKENGGENEDFRYWCNELNHSLSKNVLEDELFIQSELKQKIRANREKEEKIKKEKKKIIDQDLKRQLADLKIINEDGEENVIMSLTFQINQLLMLINNPMLFPHAAYTEMFNKIIEDDAKKKKAGKKNGKNNSKAKK